MTDKYQRPSLLLLRHRGEALPGEREWVLSWVLVCSGCDKLVAGADTDQETQAQLGGGHTGHISHVIIETVSYCVIMWHLMTDMVRLWRIIDILPSWSYDNPMNCHLWFLESTEWLKWQLRSSRWLEIKSSDLSSNWLLRSETMNFVHKGHMTQYHSIGSGCDIFEECVMTSRYRVCVNSELGETITLLFMTYDLT